MRMLTSVADGSLVACAVTVTGEGRVVLRADAPVFTRVRVASTNAHKSIIKAYSHCTSALV